VLVFGALVLLGIAGGVVAGLIYMLVHLLWTRSQVRGLQPSAERLSWKETMSAQAIAHNAVFLWFGLIALLAFVALGIFLLIADGRDWPVLLGAVMFFGICAAAFAYMLVLRRRGKADAALREHDNAR
jgi:TRAP-type C4-dicarboxylate transport system permease large subunit